MTFGARGVSISQTSRLTTGQSTSRNPSGSLSGGWSTMAEKGARSRGFIPKTPAWVCRP
jgi:hypothetical protein